MSELSDSEKEKIRQEIRFAIDVARHFEPAQSHWSKFLAHPAMVTVIGGILVAALTTRFQHISTKEQQKLAVQQQLRDKKYELLSTYAEGFHRDVITLHKIKRMKWWLGNSKQGDKYDGALTREQVLELYRMLFEQYLKENKASALSVQVQALFTNLKIQDEAKELDGNFKKMDDRSFQDVTNRFTVDNELEQFYTNHEEGMKRLVKAMAKDINQK